MTTDEDYNPIQEGAALFDDAETLKDARALCSALGFIRRA